MAPMEHTEPEEIIEREESWHGKTDGFDFFIVRERMGSVRISIASQSNLGGLRSFGIISMYPKSVGALDDLASKLPAVLQAIASEMRALGMDDLRSPWEKYPDSLRLPSIEHHPQVNG